MNATPDKELDQLRRKQRADRKKAAEIEKRMKARAHRIEEVRGDAQLLGRLEKANVELPFLVITEADRASSEADIPQDEFRAIALTILKKETGLPQRAVFGCDHGAQGGQPPYCGDEVTPNRGKAFIKALHANPMGMMNGVHWTQTTWYEKVFRVERLSADLTDPAAHLRVCLGDLAILRGSYGVADAFRRYNGAGPAADEYSRVCMSWLPGMMSLIHG